MRNRLGESPPGYAAPLRRRVSLEADFSVSSTTETVTFTEQKTMKLEASSENYFYTALAGRQPAHALRQRGAWRPSAPRVFRRLGQPPSAFVLALGFSRASHTVARLSFAAQTSLLRCAWRLALALRAALAAPRTSAWPSGPLRHLTRPLVRGLSSSAGGIDLNWQPNHSMPRTFSQRSISL